MCLNSIHLGDPTGAFRSHKFESPGKVLLVADFNGDGKLDALIELGPGSQAIVPGRGDGTFGGALPVPDIGATQSVLAGDFNGDGRIDLVRGNESSIQVQPGRGDGTFGAVILGLSASGRLGAADFNGDGKLDIVASDALLAGIGDGTFRPPVFFGAVVEPCGVRNYFAPCSYTHDFNVIADFNRDGVPAVAAGYIALGLSSWRGAAVSILLNNSPGDGFLATGISAATGTSPVGPSSLVSAFGTNLAPRLEAAATNPAPTTLGGIRLHVRDRSHANEWLAPLLYVSPTQINYVLDSIDPLRMGRY